MLYKLYIYIYMLFGKRKYENRKFLKFQFRKNNDTHKSLYFIKSCIRS